ncbi:hypothetical protein GCM10029978_075710 [Actinoallomurus acanthiterrae]
MTRRPAASSEHALTAARMCGPAVGKVLTLMIVTTEAGQYDALRASAEASREHPSRIIVVIPRGRYVATRMDAEIHVGDPGPGETLLLRLYGLLVRHAESVVLPLLVLGTPFVTWWPGFAPERLVTDAAGNADPFGALERLGEGYIPAWDTDLSWTRLTPWRSLLGAWPAGRLGVSCELSFSRGPGSPLSGCPRSPARSR